jgi:hypothetical protein
VGEYSSLVQVFTFGIFNVTFAEADKIIRLKIFPGIYALIEQKNGKGYILSNYFTHASSHPVSSQSSIFKTEQQIRTD